MRRKRKPICAVVLAGLLLGCSDGEVYLRDSGLQAIPSPVVVTTRPLLDTDLTYYSYFELEEASENARGDAEMVLQRMADAGAVIAQAWLGTSGECRDDEVSFSARLVVRLAEPYPDIASYGFTGDPAPPAHDYPWVYWYECASKTTWRYDFDSKTVWIPQPTRVPNEYPVPDSPATYFRPWYVWGATDGEWREGVEAFIRELVREGIPLERVLAPACGSDPCGQADWCNTNVVIIVAAKPDARLDRPGIMKESSNCMNICPVTLLHYEFDTDVD
jgi:hypothetical protein